ncbi:MAG: hypothetical protein ACRDNE_06140 [Gaiellaceae bacterium]
MGDENLEQERADWDRERSEEAHWRVAEAGADKEDELKDETSVPERGEPEGRKIP